MQPTVLSQDLRAFLFFLTPGNTKGKVIYACKVRLCVIEDICSPHLMMSILHQYIFHNFNMMTRAMRLIYLLYILVSLSVVLVFVALQLYVVLGIPLSGFEAKQFLFPGLAGIFGGVILANMNLHYQQQLLRARDLLESFKVDPGNKERISPKERSSVTPASIEFSENHASTYVFYIAASILAVFVFATVQMTVALEIPFYKLNHIMYLVPIMVGATFGSLIARNRILNQQQTRYIAALKHAEAELSASKEAAENANLIKSQFLSRMSHEFRTPLNAIIGFTQLMEVDALASGNDGTIENVRDVLNAGRHLLALVNDVLDFAQLGAGKLKIEPSKTNLLMIAIDSIGAVRTLAETRKIEMRLINKLLEDHGEIWAAPLRTKQALLNLLSNAIKYNKEGGSIEVALETLNPEFVRLSVKDSGIGIPEEKLCELFLPFSRLRTSNVYMEGAGIGLAITKDLVEMMGGRIGVKSVNGEGTTFWIDMPTYNGQVNAETGLFLP